MVHTRATNSVLFEFDPEIARTIHFERNFLRNLQEDIQAIVIETMAGNQTLRQLTAPDLETQHLGITLPALDEGVHFELKTGFINLLPKFHGLANEDPIMHISEFHDICLCSKPSNVTEEQLKMRAFGLTLKDAARRWYYLLPTGSIDTWEKLYKAFLDKYYPSKKAVALKRAIANVEQADDESLYEYCERFARLCASCPFHGFEEKDLVTHLYNGLLDHERRFVDAACNGSVLNLTPAAARSRINEIAEGTRSFGRTYTKKVASAESSREPTGASEWKAEMAELKSMIKGMALGTHKPAAICGICAQEGHHTDSCPQLEDSAIAEVHALGGYGPNRPRFEQNNYNQRGNDHPGFRWSDPSGCSELQSTASSISTESPSGPSTEDMLKSLTQHFTTHVQATESGMRNIEKQVGQLAESLTRLEQRVSTSLPSQTVVNPKENLCAISLRSGRIVESNIEVQKERIASGGNNSDRDFSREQPHETRAREDNTAVKILSPEQPTRAEDKVLAREKSREHSESTVENSGSGETGLARNCTPETAKPRTTHPRPDEEYEDRGDFALRQENYVRPNFPPLYSEKPPAPFPEALKDTRRPVNDQELFETFSKCEVNIPLLKLVKSIPRYAKFLKELCKIKRKQKLKGKQKVQVSERVSAMLQKQLPAKCEDPGMFTIPIVIGDTKFDKAMLDLGASINVLPSSIYESLALGPLLKTGIIIQLADGSSVHPRGVVEDVLVKVDKLIFPADFFVLDMSDNATAPIMLGRPFMSTSRTKIDVFRGY